METLYVNEKQLITAINVNRKIQIIKQKTQIPVKNTLKTLTIFKISKICMKKHFFYVKNIYILKIYSMHYTLR